MHWLLDLLFLHRLSAGHVSAVRFPHMATALDRFLFLIAGAAGIALVIWFYRREPNFVTNRQKSLLCGLRVLAVLLLLFIASGAFAVIARTSKHKGVLAALVDDSASMGIVDRAASANQRGMERAILGHSAGAGVSRAALLKGAFANPKLSIAPALAKRFNVQTFTFGQSSTITPLAGPPSKRGAWLSGLPAPKQQATQLGAAIAAAARVERGRRLDGIVVFTDGGWNRGRNPVAAARDVGVPVYTVGVGLPADRDISIPFASCNRIVFKNDAFPLIVRVKNRGYAGQSTVLTITAIDSRGKREVLKQKTILLKTNGESTQIVHIIPTHAGVYTYEAALAAMPGEMDVANNRYDRANVRVIDKKMRVLLVDNTPNWSFRFVRGVVAADRRRVAGTVFLRDGNYSGQGMPALTQFPTTAKQLNQYDAIILGDIAPAMLNRKQYRLLDAWIKKSGGGLMVVAGPNAMPRRFMNTPLARLLPVVPGRLPRETLSKALTKSITQTFRPRLTAAGRAFAPLRFAADPARNVRDWARAQKLFWSYPVRRLKPAATALLVNPDRHAARGRPMPVLAMQRYGEGKVMFFATDESWRWRTRPGPRAFRRLWSQLIATLAMTHLLGNAGRTQLEADKGIVSVGTHVHLLARVLTADYGPLEAADVTVNVRHALRRFPITLRASGHAKGVFHATFIPRAPGRYRLHLPGVLPNSRGSTVVLQVRHENLELAHPRVRVGLMKQIAAAGGGAYVPLVKLRALLAAMKKPPRMATVRKARWTLWNAPLIVLLLAGALGTEWFLRKRFDLL